MLAAGKLIGTTLARPVSNASRLCSDPTGNLIWRFNAPVSPFHEHLGALSGQSTVGSAKWVEMQVQHYLKTGDYDSFFVGWPGESVTDTASRASQKLRAALIAETLLRAGDFDQRGFVPEPTLPWLCDKLKPMVYGLFSAGEREVVLRTLVAGIVFLTPSNIVQVLTKETWLSTAWKQADIYLDSLGATPLREDSDPVVGMSQDTTCYVSLAYFRDTDPFADYVVHEAAHVLHNCRRAAIGLAERRSCPNPLDIAFGKRETFAYACEAYSQILVSAPGAAARQAALSCHEEHGLPPDERVDHDEYLDILSDAIRARNGWRRIKERCAADHHLGLKPLGSLTVPRFRVQQKFANFCLYGGSNVREA
ncbi:hypothetical protein, partial [Caballeronia fortuita]|uniref:hypothetical protein n=1 Tax=Caballeronia fortuita TaxID=1777138 RepID=UPI000AE69942